jgi:hypothetical protein
MRKQPLTLEEHRSIGGQLYDIRTQNLCLSVWIGNTYGKYQMRLAIQAEKRIDRVRSRLENFLGVEHPALPDREFLHVYYPGEARFQASWREWDAMKARKASIIMSRDLQLIADQLYQAYPVALGDQLLMAAEYVEAIAINLPDWTPKRGRAA